MFALDFYSTGDRYPMCICSHPDLLLGGPANLQMHPIPLPLTVGQSPNKLKLRPNHVLRNHIRHQQFYSQHFLYVQILYKHKWDDLQMLFRLSMTRIMMINTPRLYRECDTHPVKAKILFQSFSKSLQLHLGHMIHIPSALTSFSTSSRI